MADGDLLNCSTFSYTENVKQTEMMPPVKKKLKIKNEIKLYF